MTTKNKQIRNTILLFITAIIWGAAFVAQSAGGSKLGAFTFNGTRSFIGAFVLFIVIKILDRVDPSEKRPKNSQDRRKLLIGGILCGIALFLASSSQQIGINLGAEAGKAGFITANYILIVPIIGIFLKKKCGWNIWLGVVIALAGLFLLCFGDKMDGIRLESADILLIACAFIFSIQILLVDHYSPQVDGVRLSCIQLTVTGILSVPAMLMKEMSAVGFENWIAGFENTGAWISLLYAGVLSCGVAYTLQIVAQDGLNPTFASMIMSLESVFAAIAGAIILKEYLNGRETLGCVLTFIAIIIAEIPVERRNKE